MENSINPSNIAGAQPNGEAVFSHINLQFGNLRTGLLGRNGVGKTTKHLRHFSVKLFFLGLPSRKNFLSSSKFGKRQAPTNNNLIVNRAAHSKKQISFDVIFLKAFSAGI